MRLDPKILLVSALAIAPFSLSAFSNAPGPPIARTGLAVDGGLVCAACHRNPQGGTTANFDDRGTLTVTVANYTPGQRQKITVRLEHPDARRWGFELTARLESDQTKPAGRFIGNDTVFVRCAPTGTVRQDTCGTEVEYVNHTTASTSAGTAGGNTWEFEWEAPAANMGKVIFSAAGNAANNSLNNQGDFIYTALVSIEPAATGTRPAITNRGDTSTFSLAPTIASQGWFAITGRNLATAERTWEGAVVGLKFPTTLGGVQVKVNNKPATLFYVSPTQINALAPLDTAVGLVPVVVSGPNGDSEPMMVTKTDAAPALFAPVAQDGRWYARAQAADGSWVGKTGIDTEVRRAARPGETVAIFGSGFGATNPAVDADTVITTPAPLVTKPTIRLGQTSLDFTGNGTLVGPGLYRFMITVPADAADGDIAITAEAGGQRSANTVFLSVAK